MEYKWIPCSSCGFRGIMKKATGSHNGLPVFFTFAWKCIQCLEAQDDINTDQYNPSDNISSGLDLSDNFFNVNEMPVDNESMLEYTEKLAKGPKFLHLNINGIKSKFSELYEFLVYEKNILCFGLTETKLDIERDNTMDFMVPNYSIVRKDREEKEGGGSMLYVHESCKYVEVELPFSPPNYVECQVLELRKNGMKPLHFCLVYAPPYNVNEDFLTFFRLLCEFLVKNDKHGIILGDFNIDLLQKTNQSRKIISYANEMNFTQHVKLPTRIATVYAQNRLRTTSTLIDHIYSNLPNANANSAELCGSDHCLTYLVLKKTKVKCKPKMITFRKYNGIDEEKFAEDFSKVDWESILSRVSVNLSATVLDKQFLALIEKHAPLKRRLVKGLNQPWFTNEIRILIKERDKLRNISKQSPEDINLLKNYRSKRNQVNELVCIKKKAYFTSKFQNVRESDNIWDLFNKLTNFRSKGFSSVNKLTKQNGKETTNENEIAQLFSNQYILPSSESCVDDLSDEVLAYENEYMQFNSEYVIPEVTPEEVKSSISSIKKCAEDEHCSSKRMYKKFADLISLPLIVLFTNILKTGIVPDMMKSAKCFPLYKGKGKRLLAASYRAIFNLNFITKIFEKFLLIRLLSDCGHLISREQHGFMRGRSCETAVSLFTQDIHEIIKHRNGKSLAVYVDFKMAFDSIIRRKFIFKLMKIYNVAPYLVRVFCSYFSSRVFQIINGMHKSNWYELNNGVIPGSALGPTCFNLFIDDISNCITIPYKLYADDLVLYLECTDLVKGVGEMQKALASLENWCEENGMKINVDKTKAMFFYKAHDHVSKNKCLANVLPLKIYGNDVEFVTTFKYLGIIVDSKLMFKSHYRHVENKMNAALSRLYALRRFMPENTIKIFMSSFVTSILDYGITIWCVQSDLEITKLQNKISRFLAVYFGVKVKKIGKRVNNVAMNDLYEKLELMTIYERRKYMLIKFVYKFKEKILFSGWFAAAPRATECKPTLIQSQCPCETYKNSVKWNMIHEWNNFFYLDKPENSKNKNVAFLDRIKTFLLGFRSTIYL